MNQTLAYCATILRKDFIEYCNRQLFDQGLSQGQLFFLLYVGRHPGCSPKELTLGLRMDAGHTTRTLTRLVQDGFLTQEKSSADRRVHTLLLTEKGERAFRFSYELFAQWDKEMLQGLSSEERETLMALLSKLAVMKGGNPCVGNDNVHTC